MSAEQRHGCVHEFLALTNGLSIAVVARTLRCCSRTIRNYVAGRSPIPWHRIEMLRLLALETSGALGNSGDAMPTDETSVVANIEPDPAAPDVPPAELLAWVGVHVPHFLSSRRSFALYVRGWNVVDKIRRAKREGTFSAVLARWPSSCRECGAPAGCLRALARPHTCTRKQRRDGYAKDGRKKGASKPLG